MTKKEQPKRRNTISFKITDEGYEKVRKYISSRDDLNALTTSRALEILVLEKIEADNV